MPFETTELRKFTDAGNAIAKAAGASFEEWAHGESEVILSMWAAGVAVTKLAPAENRARVRVMRDLGFTGGNPNRESNISINAGIRGPRGRVFLRKKAGGGNQWRRTHDANFQPLWQHYKDGDWIDLQEAIRDVQVGWAKAVVAAKGALGLARQSIVQIGDSLGLHIERATVGLSGSEIAQARSAVASNGQHYQNGEGVEEKSPTKYSIELICKYPKIQQARIDQALIQTIGRRIGFFQRNAAAHVFDSIAQTARAYPYLQVSG